MRPDCRATYAELIRDVAIVAGSTPPKDWERIADRLLMALIDPKGERALIAASELWDQFATVEDYRDAVEPIVEFVKLFSDLPAPIWAGIAEKAVEAVGWGARAGEASALLVEEVHCPECRRRDGCDIREEWGRGCVPTEWIETPSGAACTWKWKVGEVSAEDLRLRGPAGDVADAIDAPAAAARLAGASEEARRDLLKLLMAVAFVSSSTAVASFEEYQKYWAFLADAAHPEGGEK